MQTSLWRAILAIVVFSVASECAVAQVYPDMLRVAPALAFEPQGTGGATPALVADTSRKITDRIGGRGAAFTIHSAILNQTRRINIATPASWDATGPDRRYPVILVFDGEYNFPFATAIAQYLADQGQIPEALVVAVENMGGPRERVRDLTPPGLSVSGSSLSEGGDRFLQFLEKELLPAVSRQFRGVAPAVLVGHSSGGIFVTWVAATRPGVFPFVVSIDAPTRFQDDWLVKRLLEAARKPGVAPLRYASYETRFGFTDGAWAELQAAAPPTWKLRREKLANEVHVSMGFLSMYLGLRDVFAEYSMLAAPISPTSAQLEHYRKFNQATGLLLLPPKPLLTRVLEDLLIEGQAQRAQTTLEMLLAGYGDTPDAGKFRAQIAEAAKLPPLRETVEDLLNAPLPDAAAMHPWLGEWRGTLQVNDAPPRPMCLWLEVKDGKVGGFVRCPDAPAEQPMLTLQYLKIVEGGLHFGFMNGMRPRGMIVFEGVLREGRLEGEQHMRGIHPIRRAGEGPPRFVFSLEKVKRFAR